MTVSAVTGTKPRRGRRSAPVRACGRAGRCARALRSVIVVAVAVVALAACGGGAPRQSARATPEAPPPREPLRPAGVAAHLRALQDIARAHGGTRAAGTPGDRATADYLVERLQAAGYAVTRQRVRFPFFATSGRPRVVPARGPLPGGLRSVRALQYTPGGSARGRVRRIGTGCRPAQAAALSDGEMAVARRGACPFRRKAMVAARAGAGALLVAGRRGEPMVSASLGRPGVSIPVLFLAHRAAAALGSGERVRVSVRATPEMRTSENVLAAARRPAPRAAMAGAHLDSVPAAPGLNDNGSGVAAVLDSAERLARDGTPPTRIRFAFWAAEELGLVGSRRFVRGLDADDRRAIVAYLNLDMVGSPRPRPTVYAARRDGAERRLERLLLAGLRGEDVRARVRPAGGRSDHSPFARAGIPVGGLFTGAGRPADPCYHRACDDLSNVDAEMAQAMAAAARRALARLTGAS